MEFKIIDTEVMDHNSEVDRSHGDEEYSLGMISVVVTVEVSGKEYWLDYQTTGTMDYGAISSNLRAYNDTEYDRLREDVGDDDVFEKLIVEIGKKAKANKLWADCVSKHYIKDESYFGGLDARSEINSAKPKHGGSRPGAGRPPAKIARKSVRFSLSDEEKVLVKQYIESIRK